MNILKKYTKSGVITTGSDDVQLDTPIFEIISVTIDTVQSILNVEILHEVLQGSLVRKHSRTFEVPFANLTTPVKVAGKEFLEAINDKILELPQYSGATEV
jgi:hypothetical protein